MMKRVKTPSENAEQVDDLIANKAQLLATQAMIFSLNLTGKNKEWYKRHCCGATKSK